MVNERELPLHVSGHACQEELKIIHGLVKPKFFIPVHGEQRHLKLHASWPARWGWTPGHPHQRHRPGDRADAQDLQAGRHRHCGQGVRGRLRRGRCGQRGPAGPPPLAQDGMVVVVVSMSGEDGALVSGPDIITRGFVYVKESEGLMDELRQVALDAILDVDTRYATDWSRHQASIKADLSNYLL